MSKLLKKIKKYVDNFPNTYTTDLENYILRHSPQNVADVEKLMFEYNIKKGKDTV